MTPSSTRARSVRIDQACADAVDLARATAVETAGGSGVGEHLGVDAEGERVVTHRFACTLRGYVGWSWSVTVTRASRAKVVTVDECVLLPGEDAVTAPSWVPWEDRVRPDDLGPGDLIPTPEDDPRLEPGYTGADEVPSSLDVRGVVEELGLGRERVLSRFGRIDAVSRWYDEGNGPDNDTTRAAPGRCGGCGFAVPIAGTMGQAFGVCTNERTPFDGTAVSWEHGCGGHTSVVMAVAATGGDAPVHDTLSLDEVDTSR